MTALPLTLPAGLPATPTARATSASGPQATSASGPRVATRLAAPEPSWQVTTDVLVAGSGVAALTLVTALADSGLRVHVVTKAAPDAGSTRWAQGGIARATDDLDDVDRHVEDTLVAGAGLCDPAAVRLLAREGRAAVDDLVALGARLDLAADGTTAQTLEGGHSRARIVHAGGDATGAEVQRALERALQPVVGRGAPPHAGPDSHAVPDSHGGRDGRVTLHDHAFLLDLLLADDGAVAGAIVADLGPDGRPRSVGTVRARATVLATGGYGQVFSATTNPAVVTGDGPAAALRAGAELADLEFVQFHPTVFAGDAAADLLGGPSPARAAGQLLLISEAVRGEGAVLVDRLGEPVMAGVHPRGDLAPRDVVAARMAAVMASTGADHLFLDARGLGSATLGRRFPTIVGRCRAAGIDPLARPIPVRPAAHYSCGGIRAGLSGRTSLPGLFAIGEAACTGVHGANRLASNSLLEGLVAGRRLAALLRADLPPLRRPLPPRGTPEGVAPGLRHDLTRAMTVSAGVLRDPSGLAAVARRLERSSPTAAAARADRAGWEASNLHTLMSAVVSAAAARTESRGCHRRTDVAGALPAWRRHLVTTLDPDTGTLRQEATP